MYHWLKDLLMHAIFPNLLLLLQALYHALPMDYVTIAKLQGKLDGEANQNTVRKLIDKMVQDGYIKNSSNRRLGKYLNFSVWSLRRSFGFQPLFLSVWFTFYVFFDKFGQLAWRWINQPVNFIKIYACWHLNLLKYCWTATLKENHLFMKMFFSCNICLLILG